jgi:hypothetical protein
MFRFPVVDDFPTVHCIIVFRVQIFMLFAETYGAETYGFRTFPYNESERNVNVITQNNEKTTTFSHPFTIEYYFYYERKGNNQQLSLTFHDRILFIL